MTNFKRYLPKVSILLLLVYSSASNFYFRSDYSEFHLLIITLFAFFISGHRLIFTKKIFNIFVVWLLYNVVFLIAYQKLSINSLFYIPVIILINYFVIIINGDLLLKNISSVIYTLSLISLFFYIIQIIDFSLAWSIVSSIESFLGIISFKGETRLYSNIFIYTLSNFPSGIPGLNRNYGFMWEPGGFATILLIGFFIHLYLSGLKFNLRNRATIVYILTILTTFSTTGYLGLMVIIAYIAIRQTTLNIVFIFAIPFIMYLLYLIGSSGFVYEKIFFTYEQGVLLSDINSGGTYGSTGRFGGMFVNFREFMDRPILGHHFDKDDRILNDATASINGLSNLLARYGIILFIIYILGYMKSSRLLFGNFLFANWIFFSLLLICAFAFSLNRGAFFMIFFSYGYLFQSNLRK